MSMTAALRPALAAALFGFTPAPWKRTAWRESLAAALFGFAALMPVSVSAQTAAQLRESDQPLEINAEEGIEWNRNDKTYIARGNARAASGEVEVLADVLTAYYREPAEGEQGESEIFLLEATGNVRINAPEGTVYGDKGQYKLDEQIFVMTGDDLRLISKDDVVTARDSLEYWEGERKAVARGKAHATHEDKQIKADVLTANFEENAAGDLEVRRIDAAGNVKITQGENQLDGDYAEVNMATGVSRLLGEPPGSVEKPKQVKALVLPRASKDKAPAEQAPAETVPAPADGNGGS